ncbi:MAG: hypothetical protein QOH09_1484 [Pseudonocardiales bacterium]|jgi:hypothetical protein|nr:hypothetical protein [Pseudonocardiales bacterium]
MAAWPRSNPTPDGNPFRKGRPSAVASGVTLSVNFDNTAPDAVSTRGDRNVGVRHGFNDRIADTTYRWHDDSVNFTHENDIKANFAEIMKGQFDTQEMISIIGADDGKYRNVWPPAIEDLVKQVQEAAWTRPVQHS